MIGRHAARQPLDRRRLALQLTPLLDLLLIVIFAQYLDIGERDRVRGNELSAARDQATTAVRERDTAEAQRSLIIEAAARLFETTPRDLAQRMRQLAGPGRTPEQRAADADRLAGVLGGDPEAVAWHLLQHEEMRKRVGLWRLHLAEGGTATLEFDGRRERFRADRQTVQSGALVTALANFAESQADAERFVVLLLTYDRDVYLATLEPLRAAMPDLVDRLNKTSESRFDFADLGFQTIGSD